MSALKKRFPRLNVPEEGTMKIIEYLDAIKDSGIKLTDCRIIGDIAHLLSNPYGDISLFEVDMIATENTLIESALSGLLVVSDFRKFCDEFKCCVDAAVKTGFSVGRVKRPFKGDENNWAVSLCTISGQCFDLGDYEERFPVLEIAKPIMYAINRTLNGAKEVHAHVGYENPGVGFDKVALNTENIPHNPYNAAGAIMCSAQIKPDEAQADRFDYIMSIWSRLVGGEENVEFSNYNYLNERENSSMDYCLAYMMKEVAAFPPNIDIEKTIEFYFMNLSIEATTRQLSYVASCLALGGICPFTGDRIFSSSVVRDCLSLMSSCGCNDYSGMFQFNIGFPCKSSTSGALLVIIPNLLGICTYSPKVNEEGNSEFGINICKELASKFNFHIFDYISRPDDTDENQTHRPGCKLEFRLSVANISPENDHAIFLFAASEGNMGQLRRMIARGVHIDQPDYDLRTAAHLAASENHVEVLEYLINIGASMNEKDRFSNTPLDDALREGHTSVAALLSRLPVYTQNNTVSTDTELPPRPPKELNKYTSMNDQDNDSSSCAASVGSRLQIMQNISTSIRVVRSHQDLEQLARSNSSMKTNNSDHISVSEQNRCWMRALVSASSDCSSEVKAPKLMELIHVLNQNGLDRISRKILDNLKESPVSYTISESMLQQLNQAYPLIGKTLEGRLIIPDWEEFCTEMRDVFNECEKNTSGETAQYIPQLANVNPEQFGVTVTSRDSQTFSHGDAGELFCVQSCMKAINYCIAIELNSRETVHRHIGREPSGRNFNDLALDKNKLPHNPLINAGAIMATSLILPEKSQAERFDYICTIWEKLTAGIRPGFSNATFLSEQATADRNFCLGYLMKESGAFPSHVNSSKKLHEVLELYFQLCSLQLSCKSLSVVAATLANGGLNPITKERVFKQETVRDCLSIMSSSGMYDYSGEFQFSIGFPCKSGVAGALLVVIPNVCGICTWSPRLDKIGNSARGVQFCHLLCDRFSVHMFDTLSGLSRGDDECLRSNRPKKSLLIHKGDNVEINLANLAYAASKGDLNEVKRLNALGVDINKGDYDGRTAFHLACSEGQLEVVRYMCAAGADINKADRWGGTPEIYAEGFPEVAQELKKWRKVIARIEEKTEDQ